jgi:hypothetical protein
MIRGPTTDRGAILHHAGFHRRSPALLDGAPVLAGHGEPGRRCGWEEFFRAMDARGLAADLGEDGQARFVPRA